MRTKKTVSMKAVILLMAVVLLVGCTIGGSWAWLMTKTASVENTFVAGDIGTLTLAETWNTDTDNDNENDSWSKIIVPGEDISKNPTVTFEEYNVAAYVFLKVEADGWVVTGNDTTYEYSISTSGTKEMFWTLEGWKKLEDGVYYQEVAANAGKQTWTIIKDNTITVADSITKDTIANYAKDITFTAYAIQQDGFETVAKAWEQAETASE